MEPSSASTLAARPASSAPALPALTGVRFFAALYVVLYHLGGIRLGPGGDPFAGLPGLRSFADAGYVAVSFFFVLSGFILAYVYLGGGCLQPLARRDFWRARFARIYPTYAVGLLITAPFFVAGAFGPGAHRSPGERASAALAAITLTQAWSPATALAWNVPGWSLSVEAFFYLLFPLAAMGIAPLGRRGLWATMATAWFVSLAAAGAYVWFDPDQIGVATRESAGHWLGALKYHPLVRLPEFVFGMCLGRLFVLRQASGAARRAVAVVPTTELLLATVGLLCAHEQLPYPMLHNGLLAPLFGGWICLLARGGGLARVLAHPAFVRLGEASYALYLLHSAVLQYGMLFLMARGRATTLPAPLAGAMLVAISVLVSLVVYQRVEVPARRYLRQRFATMTAPSETAPAAS